MTHTTDELIALFEDDFACERFRAAAERGTALELEGMPLDAWQRLIATVLRCRVLAREPIDRVVIHARRALAADAPATTRALIHAEIAYALARKRVPTLAAAAATAAAAAWPESSLGPAANGHVALAFDRRDDAVAHYTQATERVDPYRGWMGLARTRYVIGDFAGVRDALERLGDHPRTRVAALRLRADLARIAADWDAVLTLEEAILAATPAGDHRRRDLLDRASALVARGDRDAGIEQYRAVWRDDADDHEGRFARGILDHVERGGSGRRVVLPAFPTVTQKRNYCGPASLELVLRAHGKSLDQDAIAPEVKRETGSAIVAMTRFLEAQGLATRRFEGNAARFAACLELGLPVIVQEEYSTTSHVAVVIGVDLGLGLLAVQDPMTHVTSERLLSTQTSLGALYRGAAIVAYPREAVATAAALDAADVHDQRYLRLVDECGEAPVRDQVQEVVNRCDAALELCEDFPLAWYQRTAALWRHVTKSRTKVDRARFVTALFRARVRYPELEWPHLLHADYLMDDGRWDEALIELETALRCDPHDSNTAQNIAEAHEQANRKDEATSAYWRTLTIDPTHVRATENFARHLFDRGELDPAEHLVTCALELSPTNPFNHVTASHVAEARGDRAAAVAHARRAVEIAPGYSWGGLRLAALLSADPEATARDEAITLYRSMSSRWPGWFEPRWRAARQLERRGQIEEAAELLIAGVECASDDPEPLVQHLTGILLEAGDDERAAELAVRYARTSRSADMQSRLWDTLEEAGRLEAAREATAAFLAQHPQSPFAQASHAGRLIDGTPDDRARAEALLRSAIDGSPTYAWARNQLAILIFAERPDEALAILDRQPNPSEWIRLRRAQLLCSIERYDEARAAMPADWDRGAWHGQEVWNRITLADRAPEEALAATTGDAIEARRARLAFAIAAGDLDAMRTAFAAVPVTDVVGQFMANAAAAQHEELRDELAARVAARRAAATELATQRYLDALAAGNRAAGGDRGALDHYLRDVKNVRHLDSLVTPLNLRRQRPLVRELRAHLAGFAHHPLGAASAIAASALAGELDASTAAARAAVERYPRHAVLRSRLVDTLWCRGDAADATAACAGLVGGADRWVGELASRALTALVAGDRAAAACDARRARQRGFASGYGRSVYWTLRVVEAVLAGSSTALAACRDECDFADARLWQQLPQGSAATA